MTRSSSLEMWRHSIESRTKKNVKGYRFLSFARKYKNRILDTGLDSLKTISKNPRNVEEVIIPLDEKEMKYKANWENYCKNGKL